MTSQSVKLNDGNQIPLVGLGTWQSPKGEVFQAVTTAIDYGYRHFDCAYVYGNEEEVGQAIRAAIDAGKIKREDVFVTSKLWCTFHSRSRVELGIKKSLANLGLNYLDLYLIHWPISFKDDDENIYPEGKGGNVSLKDEPGILDDVWRGMEDVKEKGLARSIGVSNYNEAQMQHLLSFCKVKPALNQIERHPFLQQDGLIDFLTAKGIVVTAYSPLGSSPPDPGRTGTSAGERPSLLCNPVVTRIAAKHKKSPAQVLIRWHTQKGVACIPKSVTPERISQNIESFDFTLDDDDWRELKCLDSGYRYCRFNRRGIDQHSQYPFIRVEKF